MKKAFRSRDLLVGTPLGLANAALGTTGAQASSGTVALRPTC